MVPVTVSVTAVDNVDPEPGCAVTSVKVVDAAFSATDVEITGPLSLRLRAERSGNSVVGRTYVATVACSDVSGNQSTEKVTVTVPHDGSGTP
jgi:hypothetical protein